MDNNSKNVEEEAFNIFMANSCRLTCLTKGEVLSIINPLTHEFDFESHRNTR